MKAFKAFIFFSVMTALGFAVYYFFETDINNILAYLRGKPVVNNPKNPIINFIAGITGGTTTGGTTTGGTSTGGTSTGGTSTGGTSTGGTSTGGTSTGGTSNNGISDFSFTEKSNGQGYPTGGRNQGNGYVFVHFPSHCRVCTPVFSTPMGAYAHCEWGLKNANGEEISHLLDTIGGFHPNFFNDGQRAGKGNDYYGWVDEWAASFKPFGSFKNAQDRGNNHFDAYKKWVVEGSFTFWYQNKSNTRHNVTAGFIQGSNGEGDLNTIVEPFGYVEKVLNISWNGNEYDAYKINTNNYAEL